MKGICFKEPLFQATVEGRKTQTRRIMTPQPTGDLYGFVGYTRQTIDQVLRYFDFTCGVTTSPKYQVGEVVYLKEPYSYVGGYYDKALPVTIYKYGNNPGNYIGENWRNKLFMPESAARHFIKITAVRPERLQDISEGDCFREGIMDTDFGGMQCVVYGLSSGLFFTELGSTPEKAYATLIDKINGRGAWDSNPWVWVYDYALWHKEKER